MVTRRQLLATTGLAGATTLLAGCSGGEQSPDSKSTGSESTVSESSDTDEPEEQEILPNFSVGDISLSYGFSSGLSTTVELTNGTEQGSGVNTANVAVEAYENKNLIGEDSQWQDIQATFTAEYALAIGSVAMGRRFITDNNNMSALFFLNIGKTGCGKEHANTVMEDVTMKKTLIILTIILFTGLTTADVTFDDSNNIQFQTG